MNDDEMRIAIAEACGWRDIYHDPVNNTYCGLPPHGYFKAGEMMCHPDLPDYLNDLNAMHEAEKVTGMRASELSVTYKEWLDRLSCPHFATARQRAEALLRTLNRWEP